MNRNNNFRRGGGEFNINNNQQQQVDWDSPSTVTGTVRRRPLSLEVEEGRRTRIPVSNFKTKFRHGPLKVFPQVTTPSNKSVKVVVFSDGDNNELLGRGRGDDLSDSCGISSSFDALKKGDEGGHQGFLGYVIGSDNRRREDDIGEKAGTEEEKDEGKEGYCLGRGGCGKLNQIYTDWANHYLEKGRSKKRVNSLATDCSDGVLLAEVIESVICQKIPDINRKPKTPTQMLDNINVCLGVLKTQHVFGLDSVSAQELRDGKLKAILALFFALSRHKQAAKQRTQQQNQVTTAEMTPNRSSAIPHKGGVAATSGGVASSIPLPGSALPSRRCPPSNTPSANSRAPSPALSMIPRAPPAPPSPYNQAGAPLPKKSQQQQQQQNNNSMLDKLKLFKSSGVVATSGKRTSSSSGVSSARSERSDSSASLADGQPTSANESNKSIVRNQSRLKVQKSGGGGGGSVGGKVGVGNSASGCKGVAGVNVVGKGGKGDGGGGGKPTQREVERHALKVANLATAPKVVKGGGKVVAAPQPNTGIPKPMAAVKGTSKGSTQSDSTTNLSLTTTTTAVKPSALVSPTMKSTDNLSTTDDPTTNNDDKDEHLDYTSDSCVNNCQNKPSDSTITNKFIKAVVTTNGEDHVTVVEPMKPLFRGYCSTLTLPARSRNYGSQNGGCNIINNNLNNNNRMMGGHPDDYCDLNFIGGYMSDGEILAANRAAAMMAGCDQGGYVSEGGSVLYARRLQTMPAHIPNGSPRPSPPGLTVLTEQSARRGGRSGDDPPPPPAPRTAAAPAATATAVQNSGNGVQSATTRGGGGGGGGGGNGQWKRYTDSPGVGSPPPPPPPAPGSPTNTRRERRGSPHRHGGKEKTSGGGGGGGGGSGGKVRGVPQSFGYVKRSSSNGTTHHQVNGSGGGGAGGGGKTANVAAVPRTKVKVSGGTQTCSSDLQQSHKSNTPPQFKSYSLTGNAANQLSQSVRERLMLGSQSLPKGAAAQDYGLILRQHQAQRPKVSDGSLSDTQAIENTSPYAPWLRHSNTYSVAPRLSETDSMESLTSLPSHRSSLTHTRLLRDSPSRLSRSNSIRSTKSEKLYPSMLHRNNAEPETEPYYCLPIGALSHWSQPTSPAPGSASRSFPLSPTHSTSTPRHSLPKNDDVHGSSISLVSTASSLYSSAEEKQAHEIRKLRRELMEAQEKVHTLTSQLSTNAHVVSAFEQSLSSMTQRLQHLTATSEKKDSELQELKTAMESLRAQSIQAGIGTGLARQPSSDSVSSLSSACSLDKHDKKKKKGWLRSSFTKAFSRNAKVTKVQCQSDENDSSSVSGGRGSVTNDRSLNDRHSPGPAAPTDPGLEVVELQKQLREKDLVLTDIRLEALSSAHQLESLKDTVMKMRSEMLSLKQNNERLQRMVTGTTNLPGDLATVTGDNRSASSMDALCDLIPSEEVATSEAEPDGKRVTISVYLGQPHSFDRYYAEHYLLDGATSGDAAVNEIAIAHTGIGTASSWAQLDNAVRRAFKQHVARLDPGGGLGLGSDAIASYKLGEAERKPDAGPPDLLPVGYAVGGVATLHVVLQPVAALAFEALIPKGVAQRLVSLLSEHRRLVLCGAPGTGKTHLATRLAEFHAQSMGRDPAEGVATFNVENKSGKELRQYLAHLSEQADNSSVLPCVVVLDNLHKAGPLADALGSLPRNLPCLLGTMAQSACSATSLQLQHGFRWVLVAPHMEPARGLLGRVLRRRLAALELEHGPRPELAAILGWLPRVWQHLNAFLETHSSGDVAIGPRLLLGCPLELDAARAWFADVWNYSLAPYLREAAREGLQLYGRRAPWTDPCQFVMDSYPWPGAPPQGLTGISAKDVGLETGAEARAESEGDPLLNMLMRLQEAANYSSPHSNDSDCSSGLDSSLAPHNNIESVS